MKSFVKPLATLPLAAFLFTSSAFAAHPGKPAEPAQQMSAESLDDLEFSDREIRIIREQISAAQKRAEGARPKQPAKSLKQQLDDIKLPTDTDIKQMQKQMPDLNAMMAGLMKLATDEDMKKGMAKSADRMKKKLDLDGFETKDGMPDLNAMMSAMIGLMGDEELLEGMIDAIEPLAEFMEEIAPEAETKN